PVVDAIKRLNRFRKKKNETVKQGGETQQNESAHLESISSQIMELVLPFIDEHLPPALDLDVLSNAHVAYSKKIAGRFSDLRTVTIPRDMLRVFREAHHSPHIEKVLKRLPGNFDDLDWPRQLEFVREQVRIIKDGCVPNRARDLLSVLQRVDNPVCD